MAKEGRGRRVEDVNINGGLRVRVEEVGSNALPTQTVYLGLLACRASRSNRRYPTRATRRARFKIKSEPGLPDRLVWGRGELVSVYSRAIVIGELLF